MRLKQMAIGTVLLSGLAGAAFGQPGPQRDNNKNDNHRPAQSNPQPKRMPLNGFEQRVPSTPVQRPVQRPSQPVQRPTQPVQQAPQRVNTDYRINNNPRRSDNNPPVQRPDNQDHGRQNNWSNQNRQDNGPSNPFQRDNGNQNQVHHTGAPAHVGGTIKYQNPNHGRNWRTDNRSDFHSSFHFGLYLFSPDVEPCYVSPWYDYGALPGYVPASSVILNTGDNCQWNQGSVYSYGDVALDQTVSQIQTMFLSQDQNALNALIPDNGTVGIYTDGGYDYSVQPDEFQQMLSDNTTNVDTIGYRVTQVRKNGNQAIVKAQHTVADPNGGEDVVYQLFHLQYTDGHYVVTDLMTSHNAI